MKRLVVYIFLAIVLLITSTYVCNGNELKFNNNYSVQYFTSSEIDKIENATVVKNGNGSIVSCSSYFAKSVKEKLNDIQGITYIINGDYKDYGNIIKNLNIRVIEKDVNSLVGYFDKVNDYVIVSGKKANIQTFYNNGKIYVGIPLLLGSY